MEKSPNRKNVQERSIRSNRGQHFDINCNFHELYSNPGTLNKVYFLCKNEPSLQINVLDIETYEYISKISQLCFLKTLILLSTNFFIIKR